MRGFTLLELLIVIGIIGVIALFTWVGLERLGGDQALGNEMQLMVAVLRDAQQRSITQFDGLSWGVRFVNESAASGVADNYFLFNSLATSTAVSAFSLDAPLEFLQPNEAVGELVVAFDQLGGELVSPACPSAAAPAVIEIGIKNDPSNSKSIQIFCNGRMEF